MLLNINNAGSEIKRIIVFCTFDQSVSEFNNIILSDTEYKKAEFRQRLHSDKKDSKYRKMTSSKHEARSYFYKKTKTQFHQSKNKPAKKEGMLQC